MPTSPLKTSSLLLLSGAVLLSAAGPVYGQTGAAVSPGTDPQLGDIVVTAQKRAERLIDTPQSVTAITAADLAKLNAVQFVDFANTVPGLQFTSKGAGSTSISLRGVTTGTDIAQTVGIYVDEVPYGSSSSFASGGQLALDVGLFDIDRIEVLRGPQGTLYGASSMGGVLKYVTREPSLTAFGGSVQSGVSDTHDGGTGYNGAAVVNIPVLTDKIAVRASGFYSRGGGYVDNIGTGQKDVDNSRIYGGRVDVLLKPVDDLTIRLTGFGQNIRRDGNPFADYTLGGQRVDATLEQDHPLAEPFASNFRVASGTVSYDFGFATLTSVSSYQTARNSFTLDASALYAPVFQSIGLPVSAASTNNLYRTRKFTQEVRLASAAGHMFEWQIGAFYTHERSISDQTINGYGATLQALNLDLGDADVPTLYREYAFFGDATWHITNKLDVTGGVRYAHNNQTFEQLGSGLLVASSPLATSQEGVTTYLANARYRFSRNVMAYARFATGYRPGGPNFLARNPVTGELLAPPTFKSDTLKSYEGGVKAETADHSFAVDASVYYIDWNNIQILSAVNGISAFLNAGGAHIKGSELTLTARPDRRFTATGVFAYNDGYLTGADAGLGARKGERLPNTAHFTATATVDYVLADNALKPSVGASVRYVGKRTASFDASAGIPQYRLPDYVSTDLRAGLTLGPVEAQLYVHNLFDVRGQLSAYTILSSLGGPAEVTILQPRTVGVSGTVRF